MPFFVDTPGAADRAPGLRQPPRPPSSDNSLLGAAARQENVLVSAYNYLTERTGFAPDPDHNPLDMIADTEYEAEHLDRFVGSRSRAQTAAIMARIDREMEDRRLIESSGFPGFVASVGMGVLDPTIFIPAGTIYRGVRLGRSVGRSSLSVGAATGLMVAGQEAILYGSQETRTPLESTLNIASATILGGLLGGAIGYATSRELRGLHDTFEGFRRGLNEEVTRGIPPAGEGGAAGAAPAVREGLTLEGALGAERAGAPLSPVTRLQTSPFEAGRATIRDLGDAGLSYRENWDGVPTSEGGTVETRVKMHRAPLIEAIRVQDDAYAQYFFGRQDVGFFARQSAAVRAGWARWTGTDGGRLTAHEFREEVGKAARREDKHPIPEVQRAAEAYRRLVLTPLRDRAVELGLLPENVTVVGAASYLTRVYNRERIKQQRDVWSAILLRHFTELRTTAVRKFDDKQARKIAALEQELSDLRTPASQRAVLEAQLREELAKLEEGNPAFVALDKQLRDLRSRAANARAAAPDAERMAMHPVSPDGSRVLPSGRPVLIEGFDEHQGQQFARFIDPETGQVRWWPANQLEPAVPGTFDFAGEANAAVRTAQEGGGPEYRAFVERRRNIGARLRRLRSQSPLDEAAPQVSKPEAIGAFDAQAKTEFDALRAEQDERLAVLATLRDQALEQADSIYRQRREASKRGDRPALRMQLQQAKDQIALAHEREVRTLEREFAPIERKWKREHSAERKRLLSSLTAAERSATRAEDLGERIIREKTRKGGDLVEMLPEELPSLVDDVTNTILGESIMRLPGITLLQGPRGPLRARVLNIPDAAIEEFLESDIEKVARIYTQSMASDIELAAKFGDVRMTDQLTRLREELNAKVRAVPEGKKGDRLRKQLHRRYEEDRRDIEALRDRIRGVYRQPEDPEGIAYRAGRMALNVNYMARGGGFTLSSIPDLARPIMRYGLNAFRDGWMPLVTDVANVKLAAREVRLAGTALDMVRDQRALEMADVLDDYGRGNRFERGTQAVTDRFSMVNIMSPWNGGMKSLAGVITMAEVLRATRAVAAGTATKKQIANLAAGGVDEAMARRIWAEAEKSGSQTGRVFLPNTEAWKDAKAVEAFRAVINREVETLIVTPGLERPLWMSHPLGRIIGQFKAFAMVSTQRTTMAGLQQRDAAALSGVLVALALGAFTARIKAAGRNEDTSTWNHAKWISEALDNSGLLGVLMEANNISEKVTGGGIGLSRLSGKQISRYASRNVMGSLLGPTADATTDFLTLGRLAAPDRWTRADTHSIRKVIPFQNLFYLRQLFDMAEEGVNSGLGIPARRERRRLN